ncbi:hypothetical protein HNQ76_001462 [Thermosulfuriphilus ammonigenes]|uniref:hypothetical protein n=1 Tax=Thermosulfuriphilus ammonigenes TaxID=1936021 RepID=UPI0015EC1F81|nr:hypothetical protein [Thermosulfuriphilus ammonigenes]MBA2849073.1 hypothetical protein [Thermosulfuriphilus ammonigenes]
MREQSPKLSGKNKNILFVASRIRLVQPLGAIFIFLFFWLQGGVAAQVQAPQNRGTLWQECWRKPSDGYIGCGASDFVIKSSLCELQGYLDLAPELKIKGKQKEHFQTIMQRFNLTLMRYQSMNDMVNAQLMELMSQPEMDLKAVEEILDQLKRNCDRITRGGLRAIIKIRKTFTPQQIETITGYRPKRRPYRLPVVSCGK